MPNFSHKYRDLRSHSGSKITYQSARSTFSNFTIQQSSGDYLSKLLTKLKIMIYYDNELRQFAVASDKLGTPLNGPEKRQFIIVYRDSKNNTVRSRKLTAESRVDALAKFRESNRPRINKSTVRPTNIRAYEYPRDAEDADRYKSSLGSK